MYDSRLKHRLLHSIMMSHLPDEKQLPRSPAQLSVAVASIRRHHLLAETPSSGTPGMSKSGESRKSVVDGWVDHLLGLLCSTVVCFAHLLSLPCCLFISYALTKDIF